MGLLAVWVTGHYVWKSGAFPLSIVYSAAAASLSATGAVIVVVNIVIIVAAALMSSRSTGKLLPPPVRLRTATICLGSITHFRYGKVSRSYRLAFLSQETGGLRSVHLYIFTAC